MIKMLSGNEAVARGAWEAGAAVASAYPGTPSTEILEELARYPNVYAEWAPNEKVAVDVAIGAAYAGRRAMAVMKHVGLNVAADAFMYASMTGMEAGLVIVSADDPAMHSSQNEQDNRTFARFARVPCLEPSDSQEAKDMTIAAFGLSERFDTPVLMRLTTRICHSTSAVELGVAPDGQPLEAKPFPRNPAKYVMVPSNAVKRHPVIEQRMLDVAEFAESFPYNHIEQGERSLGILTAGVAYQYAREVFPKASILRLGMTWPLPARLISRFAESVERLIVIEELDPFIEEAVRLMGICVEGKSIFPLVGELDPRVVRESAIQAGLLPQSEHVPLPGVEVGPLPSRPPVLCPGCPHRSTFYVLNKLKVPVNGDIGCYTLGLIPPLSAIHSCGCMGASIAVAHGAVKAGSPERHVAVIGDSTFFHTGIPALINTVYNRSPVITIIMDNRVTGMTGHQDNPGTGRTLQGEETTPVEIEALVRACGIRQVKTVPAYAVKEIETTLREYLKLDEPAVLITQEPCVLLPEVRKRWVPLEVWADKCNGCGLCFRIGCPAILKSDELDAHLQRPKALIDAALCTGCEVCAQICPREAITFRAAEMSET
ncbi:MAG: indolepyruvate ferredoxin oxidoreductase subunit alpha [Chloroflexi bacterium RBG_16_54_11]|nr:MAG: indolepyruvate ferredoxin oxidoreductase subunit alpha [Chloroflexi bacterium RBG_16_54_11]